MMSLYKITYKLLNLIMVWLAYIKRLLIYTNNKKIISMHSTNINCLIISKNVNYV